MATVRMCKLCVSQTSRECEWRKRCIYLSERSSSTKLKLNESNKRKAWLSLRDLCGQPTVRSVMLFGVVDIFCFLGRLFTSETMVHHDRTRPVVVSSEPSEAVKE